MAQNTRFKVKKYQMEVITIDSQAFKVLIEKLDALFDYVNTQKLSEIENDDDHWVDSQEICDFLKISERTLQRLRRSGQISYTNLGGKYYYQISQVKRLLKERLIKSTDECFQELKEHHKQREYKRKNGR